MAMESKSLACYLSEKPQLLLYNEHVLKYSLWIVSFPFGQVDEIGDCFKWVVNLVENRTGILTGERPSLAPLKCILRLP